jgi:beta-lactamase class A
MDLSYYTIDLTSGVVRAQDADQPRKSASIIKLPILVHAALTVAEGAARWDERVALGAERAGGMGVLKLLDAGLALTLRDLVTLMTVISDNTATNLVIERFGAAAINARIRALDLPQTTLFRPVFAPDTAASAAYGLGVTTARETGTLLARVARRELGDPATADLLLGLLAAQQDRVGIPRGLPAGWRYAGKTGSDTDLRNDAAIVTAPDGRQHVVTIFCQPLPPLPGGVDHPGLLAIRDLAERLFAG